MLAVAPRSTCSHCGSLNADDQRVPVLPSTAADAGVPAFSVEEAVAALPCEMFGSAARATGLNAGTTLMTERATAEMATAAANAASRERRLSEWCWPGARIGAASSVKLMAPPA